LKKLLVIFVIAVFAITMMGIGIGCKQEAAEEEEVAEETEEVEEEIVESKGKLTIPVMEGWACIQPFIDRIGEFEEETGYEVEFHGFPLLGLMEKQILEATSPTGIYDAAMLEHEMTPTMRDSGSLLPLNDFIERDFGSVEEWKSMFFPLIEMCQDADGNIFSVPFHTNMQYIIYRDKYFNDPVEKDNFKAEYGYELKPPETYEELIDVAKFFTRDTDSDGATDLWGIIYGGAFQPALYGWFTMATSMGMEGTKFVDDNGEILLKKGSKDYEAALKAFQYWYDLIYKYEVAPTNTVELGHAEIWEMWKADKIAMSQWWWGDYWMNPDLNTAGETKSLQVPHIEGVTNYGWSSWWTMGIFKSSSNPEATWEFIKWITSEEIQNAMSEATGQAAPMISLAEEQANKGWIAPALAEQLKHSTYPPPVKENVEVFEIIRTTLGECLSGSITPQEAVDAVSSGVEDIFKQ
jgi:multiple sugar transport system substrate-binding protein